MFVIVTTYCARVGEEDALIALHEDWQRNQQSKAQGYISGELLRNIQNSREFIALLHFESREFAQALANDPEYQSWSMRLTSLSEGMPVFTEYRSEWHSQDSN